MPSASITCSVSDRTRSDRNGRVSRVGAGRAIEDFLSRKEPELRWLTGVWKAAAAAICAEAGRVEQALSWLADVMPAIARAPGEALNYVAMVFYALQTLWLIERTDHLDVIEANLRSKYLEPDYRYPSCDSRLAMAWACSLRKRFDEAHEWFDRSRETLDAEGSRSLRSRVDYEEAVMLSRRRAAGDREQALALLDAALSQFQSLGLTGLTTRAQELRRTLS